MATLNKNAPQKKTYPPLEVTIVEWKPLVKNTMQAIIVVGLPQVGVKMLGCTYHVRASDNKRWVGLPAKPYEAKGVKRWSVMIEALDSSAHWRLQNAILKAIDVYLGDSQERPQSESDSGAPEEPLY